MAVKTGKKGGTLSAAAVATLPLKPLIGHSDCMDPLFAAEAAGRLASTLLFAGPPGIGKRLAALSLAQSLICERPQNRRACGTCGACLRVASGQSESVKVIEPDGASIKIEQAREVQQFISLQKLGRARVVIFNQAHLMNAQTANSLLKSLEEPPDGTYFILVTSLAASILPTIRSRAQLVRFRPLSKKQLREILGPDLDDWVLEAARGSVETARHLLDSAEEFHELEGALLAYLQAAEERFPAAEASTLKEMTKEKSAQTFVAQNLLALMRDLFRARLQAPGSAVSGTVTGIYGDLARLALARMTDADLHALGDLVLKLEGEMARNIDRGLLFENLALRWRRSGATYGMD